MAKKKNVRAARAQENSTDVLYAKLLTYAEQVHQSNKRRIKNGVIALAIIPALLIVVRLLTDSSRIVFLIIWIVCMFVDATFMIYVAYVDWQLQNVINELSRDELGEFDSLIGIEPPLSSLRLLADRKREGKT